MINWFRTLLGCYSKEKASASANTLTIKGSATEEAIRSAVEGIGYTFRGKA